MEISKNKTRMGAAIALIAICGYFLIVSKPNKVIKESLIAEPTKEQESNSQNILTEPVSFPAAGIAPIAQDKEVGKSEEKDTLKIANNNLSTRPSSKVAERKLSGVELHRSIVKKFENEEVDYIWSDNKRYLIAESFSKSLHDTTHALVDEVVCKTTVCKVDYEFEYDSEDAISFIELLTEAFSSAGWKNVNHGSIITDGDGTAKVSLWLHDFIESEATE